MAGLNEILVGRYNRALQKLFGIKGSAPTPSLAPEIFPVHNLKSGGENRILEGWHRFGVRLRQAGVAASLTSFRLRNPIGSNVIAVVEKFSWIASGATGMTVSLADQLVSDLGTLVVALGLDGRQGLVTTRSVLIASMQAGTAGGDGIFAEHGVSGINITNEIILTQNSEIVITPGTSLAAEHLTVNLTGIVSLWWRERFLEESERSA